MENKGYEKIYDCLQEIIDTLCYQPDIPLVHKEEMLNKLGEVSKAYYQKE